MVRPIVVPALIVALGILAGSVHATTWYILPDGSGDAPTIQAGLDAALPGDTVLLACGTYYEHDIDMASGVTLRSEAGRADCATIDAQGLGRVMVCAGIGSNARIEGVTFRGGIHPDRGGGILCESSSAPAIEKCDFAYNSAGVTGGAIHATLYSPLELTECAFYGNSAPSGCAISSTFYSTLSLTRCTVAYNTSPAQSAVLVVGAVTDLNLMETIVAFNTGYPVSLSDPSCLAIVVCTDIFGNSVCDWCGDIGAVGGINSNFSEDPLFCDALGNDYHIRSCSPCVDLPGSCGQVGAYGLGECSVLEVPGEWPTIQSALDAACAGDTVLVACGTYAEPNINVKSGVCLRSETGEPDCAILSGQWTFGIMQCYSVDSSTRIEGFSLFNGRGYDGGALYLNDSHPRVSQCLFAGSDADQNGGAVFCEASSPVFTDCRFGGNEAYLEGGAVYCRNSTPSFVRCVFDHNTATLFWGGAMFLENSPASISHCVFYGNRSDEEGSAILSNNSTPQISNTIIAFNWLHQPAISCWGSVGPSLSCSDIYGNGGDWVGCIASQATINGNFSTDPLFCDAPTGDFTLSVESPCLDAPGCGLVGTFGTGCFPQRIWRVPEDAPTIGAAVDSSVYGDTIIVACGTYYEREIELKEGVVVRSETGEPDCATVDAEGLGRAFIATSVTNGLLKGFTITNGWRAWGAGIFLNASSITVENCLLHHNEVYQYHQGGGICLENSNATLRNLTIVENTGNYGAGMALFSSSPVLENCLVAFNNGLGVYLNSSSPTFYCSDLYGNTTGDWVGGLAGQLGVNGNFSADPFFCPEPAISYSVDAVSPCLPENNDCGVLVGALGEGCAVVGVSDPADGEVPPPRALRLHQNVPNPFNPTTTIRLGLPAAGPVRLVVYDLSGRLVDVLLDEVLPAGYRSVRWDGRDEHGRAVASGAYLLRLEAGGEVMQRKMLVLR